MNTINLNSQYHWEDEQKRMIKSPASVHRRLAKRAFSLAKRLKHEGDNSGAWQATNAGRKMILLASKEERLWQMGVFLSKKVALLTRYSKSNIYNTSAASEYSSPVKRKKSGPVDIRGSECFVPTAHMQLILNILEKKVPE